MSQSKKLSKVVFFCFAVLAQPPLKRQSLVAFSAHSYTCVHICHKISRRKHHTKSTTINIFDNLEFELLTMSTATPTELRRSPPLIISMSNTSITPGGPASDELGSFPALQYQELTFFFPIHFLLCFPAFCCSVSTVYLPRQPIHLGKVLIVCLVGWLVGWLGALLHDPLQPVWLAKLTLWTPVLWLNSHIHKNLANMVTKMVTSRILSGGQIRILEETELFTGKEMHTEEQRQTQTDS